MFQLSLGRAKQNGNGHTTTTTTMMMLLMPSVNATTSRSCSAKLIIIIICPAQRATVEGTLMSGQAASAVHLIPRPGPSRVIPFYLSTYLRSTCALGGQVCIASCNDTFHPSKSAVRPNGEPHQRRQRCHSVRSMRWLVALERSWTT